MNSADLARFIDHTNLKPEATPAQIEQLCSEAKRHGFYAVCVNPVYVPLASQLLADSGVKICTVAGFPLGATSTAAKVAEAVEAIRRGAQEVDMVLWVGGLKAGRDDDVFWDIAGVARAVRDNGAILKVIFECALLSDDEKRRACDWCLRAGAHYVKTSTGFGPGGATVEDVKLLHELAGTKGLGVKAAGGIRTLADALKMIESGATRIGCSASVKIVEEAKQATA